MISAANKVVVLLSGGLDSTVALATTLAALDRSRIIALTFDYGQVNRAKELAAARNIARHYGVEHRIVGLSNIFVPSALTGGRDAIPTDPATNGPDATFVPGRNMVLISVGVAIAQGSGAGIVITGCNADDAAGYPDTTTKFLKAVREAAYEGYGITLCNPLVADSKRTITLIAEKLRVPVEYTWSCYRGTETQCGNCGSCKLNREAASA